MTRVNRQIWKRVKKEERKLLLQSLFLLFFCLFYPLFVCIICAGIFLFCTSSSLIVLFWLSYKVLMKAFQANMLIFVSMGIQKASQCHRGFGQQTGEKHCCLFFFHPSFIRRFFFSTLHFLFFSFLMNSFCWFNSSASPSVSLPLPFVFPYPSF